VSLFGRNQKDPAPEPALGTRPQSAPRSPEDVREPQASTGRIAATAYGREDMANIGKSISIKGDLTGNEDLQIDGNVEGRIDLPNNQLTIGADGKVKAEVHAKAVIVVGHVTGNVAAAERCEVKKSGIVDGDVRAPRLVIEEGAVLNGSVEMGDKARAAAGQPAPRPKAAVGGDAA
jgi:cytoskeletal protein CcmA (bactofilin family)